MEYCFARLDSTPEKHRDSSAPLLRKLDPPPICGGDREESVWPTTPLWCQYNNSVYLTVFEVGEMLCCGQE